jgi:hypothetical protein
MKFLAAQAEALCRAVAPEVASGPLYIVLHADLPPELRVPNGPAGLTTRHLDLILRPTQERLGRWRGRGPAMIVDPTAISEAVAHRDWSSRRRAFAPAMLGVVLHELAHILDAELMNVTEPEPELVMFARLSLAAELNGVTAPTNGPAAPIPWQRHEWRFIRTALHLAHRATTVGTRVFATDVFDATEYGLSSTWQYVTALGDEPERLAACDFAAIQATPPPAAFAELWRADFLRWLSQAQPNDEITRTLAACGRRIFITMVAQEAPPERQGSLCCQNC